MAAIAPHRFVTLAILIVAVILRLKKYHLCGVDVVTATYTNATDARLRGMLMLDTFIYDNVAA